MTLKTNGKIIYAGNAEIGKYYITAKGGIVVKILKVLPNTRVVVESSVSENEVEVRSNELFKEVNQEEVLKVMAKKTEEKIKKEGKVRVLKTESKTYVDYKILEPFMRSGYPVKVKDLVEKVKVEKTTRTPYCRIYTSLYRQAKAGVLKCVSKGTFQLTGSNKKAESVELKPKKEKVKVKTESKPETSVKPEPVKTDNPL